MYTQFATGINPETAFNDLKSMEIFTKVKPTITTTQLGGEINLPEDFMDGSSIEINLKMNEMIDELFPEEGVTCYSNLNFLHYSKMTPKFWDVIEPTTKEKGVRITGNYAVMLAKDEEKYTKEHEVETTYDNLPAAKRAAKKIALDTLETVAIKRLKTNGDMFRIGYMDLESDGNEYKKKRKQKDTIYLPVYKYLFFINTQKEFNYKEDQNE